MRTEDVKARENKAATLINEIGGVQLGPLGTAATNRPI
jgi:hypothetical protein